MSGLCYNLDKRIVEWSSKLGIRVCLMIILLVFMRRTWNVTKINFVNLLRIDHSIKRQWEKYSNQVKEVLLVLTAINGIRYSQRSFPRKILNSERKGSPADNQTLTSLK